tara:strand:- start:348 stop:602 length:255 start_codon:yes stop_codon:yes gene_type:complete
MSEHETNAAVNPFVAKMAEIFDKSAASQRKTVITQTEKLCRDYEKQIDKLMKKIDKMETESSASAVISESKSTAKRVRAPKAPN